MQKTNIILVKNIEIGELKDLLNEDLYYPEKDDMIIYQTKSPRKHVICIPNYISPSRFMDIITDMLESDMTKDAVFQGWFVADDNILRAKSGGYYMVTSAVDDEGNNIPLYIDEDSNNFLDYVHDDSEERNNMYSKEDDAFVEERGIDDSTCFHKTSEYTIRFKPCNLPQVTTSENFHPSFTLWHHSSKRKEENTLPEWFDKPIEKLLLWPEKLTEKIGWLGKTILFILWGFLFILLTVILYAIFIVGMSNCSDTIMDFNISIWDCLALSFLPAIAITAIRQKGLHFTDSCLRSINVYGQCIGIVEMFLTFVVFTTNKNVSGTEHKEVIAKIISCEEVRPAKGTDHNELTFTIPISTVEYDREIDIDDKSYFNCDNCIVGYHKGCLGMYVIDYVRH